MLVKLLSDFLKDTSVIRGVRFVLQQILSSFSVSTRVKYLFVHLKIDVYFEKKRQMEIHVLVKNSLFQIESRLKIKLIFHTANSTAEKRKLFFLN